MNTRDLLQQVITPTSQIKSIIDPATVNVHEYWHLIHGPDKDIWKKGLANDLGRLAKGIGQRMLTGTNTIYFCHPSTIPADRTVTYARLVSSLRLTKEEEHRVRVTVGGDCLDYLGLTATDTDSLTTLKLVLNSVIYMLNFRFMTMDTNKLLSHPYGAL